MLLFFCMFMRGGVFAWEEKSEEFMHIEFEAEKTSEGEIRALQKHLSELEFYCSEPKAQEGAALRALGGKVKKRNLKLPQKKLCIVKSLPACIRKNLKMDSRTKMI